VPHKPTVKNFTELVAIVEVGVASIQIIKVQFCWAIYAYLSAICVFT